MCIDELCTLKWSDIDFKNKTLKINKTMLRLKNTDENSASKTKIIIDKPKLQSSNRTILLPDFIIKLIKPYSKLYNENSYFLTGDFNFIEPRVYHIKFKKYLKQAGINKVKSYVKLRIINKIIKLL